MDSPTRVTLIRISIVAVLLATGCPRPAPPLVEEVSIPFSEAPTTEWIVAYRDQNDQGRIVQYVPAGQSATAWTEMITVHGFRELEDTPSPEALMRQLHDTLREDCREVQWTPIETSAQDAAYEVIHRRCTEREPAYEIGRFMLGETYTYQLTYQTKVESFSEAEREKWLAVLARSGVIQTLAP